MGLLNANITDDSTLLYMMRQAAYPLGSVYMTVSDDDPAKLFGGKWEQLPDINSIHVWKRVS